MITLQDAQLCQREKLPVWLITRDYGGQTLMQAFITQVSETCNLISVRTTPTQVEMLVNHFNVFRSGARAAQAIGDRIYALDGTLGPGIRKAHEYFEDRFKTDLYDEHPQNPVLTIYLDKFVSPNQHDCDTVAFDIYLLKVDEDIRTRVRTRFISEGQDVHSYLNPNINTIDHLDIHIQKYQAVYRNDWPAAT